MKKYKYAMNYDDLLLAELYDQMEHQMEDVTLLKGLMGTGGPYRILECFSGTGRIFIPLLEAGHNLTGIELAGAMNQRAIEKIQGVDEGLLQRVNLLVEDVLTCNWGEDYDLIVIGNNALFELATSAMQEQCIAKAYQALRPGGKLFLDTSSWHQTLTEKMVGDKWVAIEGTGEEGGYGRLISEVIAIDEENQVMKIKRTWVSRTKEGKENTYEYEAFKHPATFPELESWVKGHNFHIIDIMGNYKGEKLTAESPRVIFWAEKK